MWWVTLISCLALVTSSAHAQAPAPRTDGTVMRVDSADLVVDIGSGTGASEGSTYRLYRPIEVRHPVTRRVIRDRFPIGEVRITSLGNVLSLARPVGTVARPPAVGDELAATAALSNPYAQPPAVRTAPPSAEPARAAGASAPPTSVSVTPPWANEERDALQTFLQTLGRAPEYRISLYQDFLARHPGSTYTTVLRADQRAMQQWVADRANGVQAAAIVAQGSSAAGAPSAPVVHGERLVALDEGQSATVDLQLAPGSNVGAALIHIRTAGGVTYETYNTTLDEHGFLRIAIPEHFLHPGGFDYFVEVVTHDGMHIPAFGEPEIPVHVIVHPLPVPQQSTAGLTRIDVRTDFIDRNQLRGNDQYFILEGDFYQRLRFGPLTGYRVGFGIYRGVGGSLQALDRENRPPEFRQAVLGYHELEFQVARMFAFILRMTVGMDLHGVVGGGQLRLRFGEERAVHLMVGGEAITAIGQRAFIQIQFRPHPRVPLGATAEVTHFEYDGPDPSFRLAWQTGWQITSWFAIAARLSYQARTITHAGPGVGLAATFDW